MDWVVYQFLLLAAAGTAGTWKVFEKASVLSLWVLLLVMVLGLQCHGRSIPTLQWCIHCASGGVGASSPPFLTLMLHLQLGVTCCLCSVATTVHTRFTPIP